MPRIRKRQSLDCSMSSTALYTVQLPGLKVNVSRQMNESALANTVRPGSSSDLHFVLTSQSFLWDYPRRYLPNNARELD